MDAASSFVLTGLAPLQVGGDSIYQHHGPPASPRMAVLPPGQGLRDIEHIEISRYVEREGVLYYVLEIFTHTKPNTSTTTSKRMAGGRDIGDDDILIDVDLNAAPTYTIERRFSDFEALRHKLSVCFESLHIGSCSYCDPFIAFLSKSSTQPGLFTKLTKTPAQRKGVLAKFINRTVRLAISKTAVENVDCDGGAIIPQVVETFLKESRSIFSS